MVDKKIVVIASIIAIIIVGAIICIKLKLNQNTNETYINIVSEKSIQNTAPNNEQKPQEVENAVLEEVEEHTVTEEPENSVEGNTSQNDVQEASGEDKAKELAQKEWGKSDDTVYYYLEEKISDNVYIISVRNKETTASLMDYEINIQTGSVEEY